MADPISEADLKPGELAERPVLAEMRRPEKVFGSPRERLEDEVRHVSRVLESLGALPHEVARLRKELESLKAVPRDLARAEGACAAGRRSAENRLRAIEQVQQRLADGQKGSAEKLEKAALETAHLGKALEATRALADKAAEAHAAWKAARQELDALNTLSQHSAEGLSALAGLPRELAAASEAWTSSEARFEKRLQELEAAGRAGLRAQDEAAQRGEQAARGLEAVKGELARLQGLPQRLEEAGQAENARHRAGEVRLSGLEAQARDLDRRARELEDFMKEATRHLDSILQRVADALPEDALGTLCGRMEEIERRLARLEFRK